MNEAKQSESLIRGSEIRELRNHIAELEKLHDYACLILDAATARISKLKAENARLRGSTDRRSYEHQFQPDKKHPWFCSRCGYGPHDEIMHTQKGGKS